MGPADAGGWRWSFPIPRSASLVLLLGLLLLALLAVASGAGGRLFQRDPLLEAVTNPSPSPTPAPSGTAVGDGEAWIAFMASFGSNAIEAVRPDGTGRHPLFPFVPGGEQQHPDWSPDGKRLVFSVIGTDTQVTWVGDADGANTSLLVDCQAPCKWVDEPAWSPDGTSIAYQRMVSKDGAGVSTLEILDLATRQTRVVFTARTGQAIGAPRWSGDGTRVVFEIVTKASPALDAEVTGNSLAILDLTAQSPTPREITKPADRCNNPDWSWVNDRIVCTKPALGAGYDGPSDLYTVRPDGTGFAALTDLAASGGEAIKPTWLPDGSGVIFNSSGGLMTTIATDGTGRAPAISGDPVSGLHPRVRPTP
jgi:Tol biopolymer transport system component